MKILVSGGTGYIGSHTAVVLLGLGYEVVLVDNLSNSKPVVVDRIKEISEKDVTFYPYNICDEDKMEEVFSKEKIDAVIHFAALKAVGESVEKPLEYYDNNLNSTLTLLKVMERHGVKNLVFSSSATVYGSPKTVPIKEDFPLHTTNPYGTTKLFIERILEDYAAAKPDFNVIILRYFNPIGAHKSGKIGEDPAGVPKNILPYVAQVAVGKLDKVMVTGNDYETKDGTGVRDYVHVVDLAEGHAAAIKLFEKEKVGLKVYNLGTGKGYSVLEIISAFSKACGKEIPYEFAPRRPGDIAECYADCSKAKRELDWEAKRSLDEMCEDSWRWQSNNPNGFN